MVKLFEGIKKDHSNADIGWMLDKAPFYSYGYLIAARELSNNYEKRDVREKDTLVFPIVFLYRQFVELTLKDLIREIDFKLSYKRSDNILDRHTLLPLWDEALKRYEDFVKINNVKLIFTVPLKNERDIVNQFDQTDAGSYSFRYAKDLKRKDTLSNIEYISVNNFTSQIEIVVSYLQGMEDTLCDYT